MACAPNDQANTVGDLRGDHRAVALLGAIYPSDPGIRVLQTDIYRAPGAPRRVVVARLVMPAVGAQGLAAGLYDFLKKGGFDPMPAPADPRQIQ